MSSNEITQTVVSVQHIFVKFMHTFLAYCLTMTVSVKYINIQFADVQKEVGRRDSLFELYANANNLQKPYA